MQHRIKYFLSFTCWIFLHTVPLTMEVDLKLTPSEEMSEGHLGLLSLVMQ